MNRAQGMKTIRRSSMSSDLLAWLDGEDLEQGSDASPEDSPRREDLLRDTDHGLHGVEAGPVLYSLEDHRPKPPQIHPRGVESRLQEASVEILAEAAEIPRRRRHGAGDGAPPRRRRTLTQGINEVAQIIQKPSNIFHFLFHWYIFIIVYECLFKLFRIRKAPPEPDKIGWRHRGVMIAQQPQI